MSVRYDCLSCFIRRHFADLERRVLEGNQGLSDAEKEYARPPGADARLQGVAGSTLYADMFAVAANTSAERKATPIFSGVLRYFPDALAAVARVSKRGNEKHNPGQPLHWSRGKSDDHGDCIARHQITFDEIDPEIGEYHAALVAWRALAQLQLLEEKRLGKKVAA